MPRVRLWPVAAYFAELTACGRPATTQRSYGMDLLRWFRFLWAVGVAWDQATGVEARDFCRWLQIAHKPVRPHWRRPDGDVAAVARSRTGPGVNAVTGKAVRGSRHAAATVAHCETVLRGFYDFHLEAGSGPMVNPFPLARYRGAGRVDAHHNPMEPFAGHRSGRYRPKVVDRAPRCIPDERFDELFAQLGSHRDRALVAFWVSTGARASELLGVTVADVDPGQQLIMVIRKGTRVTQPLPAAPEAFVWLRLYQAQLAGVAPGGRDQPLWWTLREPLRPLRYDAARAMFNRANAVLLAIWIAVGFIFRGVSTTATAISEPDLPGRGWAIFAGVVSIIAGIVVLAWPFDSIVILALVVGIWLIVIGVVEIVSAFQMRKDVKTI
jgi:integrase